MFAAWRAFFEGLAKSDPLVMVFEDLHWADPGLIDFIEQTMEWARTSPIFILTLARPELREKRPDWGAGARSFTSIHLDPLSDEEMALLLKGVTSDLPTAVGDEIVRRAEGVPLYAVEMIRMLIDRGGLVPTEGGGYRWTGSDESIEVPDSLHSLIASRLDALPLEDRLVVQDASVLGKTFTLTSLAAVSGRDEQELGTRSQDLIRREVFVLDEDPRSPERGQYGFVQSLIREIAYQTLSNSDRRDRHLRAAEHFAALQEAELVDVVATHYVEAYQNSPKDASAEALAEAARTNLVEAAQRARSLGSSSQAVTLLEKALQITPDGQERGRLLRMAGTAAASAGKIDTSIERLEAAVEILKEGDDRDLLSRARAELGTSYFHASRVTEAMEMLESALEELEDPAHDPGAASLYAELARQYTFAGEFEKSARFADLAMVPAERFGDLEAVAEALITRGVIALMSGRVHESDALIGGGIRIAEENDLAPSLIRGLINLAANQTEIHPALALATAEKGLELSRRYGMSDGYTYVLSNYINAACALGRFQDATDKANDALENELTENLRHLILPELARVATFVGDVDRADALLKEFAGRISESSSVQDHAVGHEAKALVELVRGEPDAVLSEVNRFAEMGLSMFPSILMHLAHAAAWWRLPPLLDRARGLVEEVVVNSSLWRTRRMGIDAVDAALSGSRDAAADAFRRTLARWDELDIPLERALCQMDMALALGGPDAADAKEAAIRFFSDAGNEFLVARLREAQT